MVEKVLSLLRDKEDYISGENMSKELGVTRASIWKTIKKLKEEGYNIESSTKKGYKLIDSPNVITAPEVLEHIKTETLGKEIKYYSEIGSTNEEAKKLARDNAKEGTLVIADKQISGKGRLGKVWDSPRGTGIWMSLILRPHIMPSEAGQLTLIAGLNMCEAIEKITGLKAEIKWPNDIIINGKKVCGILTEMSAELEQIKYVIVGIGVNVNNSHFPEELPYASSLKLEGKKEYIRKDIIKAFLEGFEKDYDVYTLERSLEPFLERYKAKCATLYKRVKVIAYQGEYVAQAQNIASDGSLVIETEDGVQKTIFAGEVSVRGLYGYVD